MDQVILAQKLESLRRRLQKRRGPQLRRDQLGNRIRYLSKIPC